MTVKKPVAATFDDAFLAAQDDLGVGVTRNANNSHFTKHKYADLGAVIAHIKPALAKHGLYITQAPLDIIPLGNIWAINIQTKIVHAASREAGIDIQTQVPLPKLDPQAIGSATTYGCRYGAMAATGLPPVDDDGEAAMNRSKTTSDGVPICSVADLIAEIDEIHDEIKLREWGMDNACRIQAARGTKARVDEAYRRQIAEIRAVNGTGPNPDSEPEKDKSK